MIKDYSIGDQVSCVCNQCPVLSKGCFCLFFSISLHPSPVQMVSRSKCSAYYLHHTETDRHTCTHTYTLSQLILCPKRHRKQCCPKLFLVISNEVTDPGRDTDLLYLYAMPERRNRCGIWQRIPQPSSMQLPLPSHKNESQSDMLPLSLGLML